MKPIVKNIIAVIVGLIVGMSANMLLVYLGMSVVDYPETVTMKDSDTIGQSIRAGEFEFKHYIFPFIAHSMQALLGAFICTKIAASNYFKLAMLIGVISLIGGIWNSMILGTSFVANIIDWIAYLPMAYLGWRLGMGSKRRVE